MTTPSKPMDSMNSSIYQAVFESSPMAMLMIDSRGTIVLVNALAENLFGYPRDEMLGQPVEMLVPEHVRGGHPALRETYQSDPVQRSMGTGRELTGQRKDGSEFPIEVALNPAASGSDRYVVAAMVDISARKRAEMERNAYLMVDALTDTAVIRLDPDGIIRSWNRGARQLLGYEADDIIGQSVTIFHGENDVRTDLTKSELATALRTGHFELEGWRLKQDGSRFWAGVVLQPIHTEEGEHAGFVKVVRDLTERVEREQTLQRQRDEILELSTPVIQVWDKILALPIIGTLDSERAMRLTETLLEAIARESAEFVIVDISGVPAIDSEVAQHLLQTISGARLMGAESILSGVRPETAQAMVHLGIEIGSLRSCAVLQDALELAIRLHREIADR